MTDKKKADWLCDLSLVLFVISLAFIAVLAASTAKLDDFTQIVAAILAAVFFIGKDLRDNSVSVSIQIIEIGI